MKSIKISSFIFILILLSFFVHFIGYKVLSDHMISDHEKNTKILFYEIKNHTSSLLSKLLAEYHIQKEPLKKKHEIVIDYMNTHDLDVDLDEIYQKINKGHKNKPYNIYITDKDLVIRNATYKNDIGFDISFAKNAFDMHNAENVIGCTTPIREKISKNFLSYTDSYLSKNGDDKSAILQVSYAYQDTTQEISALLKIIQKYPSIKDLKAYSVSSSGYVYEIILQETDISYKPTIQSKIITKERALYLAKKLEYHNLIEEDFMKEDIPYKSMYMSAYNHSNKDIKIIYTILIDQSDFYDYLTKLDMLLLLLLFMAIIGILIILKLRGKEIKLSEQDTFVQSAMHEIKTPLSIITLNNELRQLEYGTDTYSEEIDNALKVLHNSYRSMSFIMTKDQLAYEVETLDLSEILKQRIEYFQNIAIVNDKKIISHIDSHLRIDISLIELSRLIDNSLYNAIKYGAVGSPIKVVLSQNTLSFHNKGKVIENQEKVFHKYFRENKTVGGYGLGLSIIKDIADKYGIDIKLRSDLDKGTTFTYTFKSHTDDIS